ncbi:hypothetical protein ACWDR3_01220 [Streptomyces sp. NPDC001002]
MHIPAYARDTIRAALPSMPTSRQVGALDCCLCDEPFDEARGPVPLGPTPTSGLFGCGPCLTRLVKQARRSRDARLVRDAERARDAAAAWEAERERYSSGITSVREAAEAVGRLAAEGAVEPLRIAWLYVSLESAYAWAPEGIPEPPESLDSDAAELRDERFRLDLEMISAREAVADRLVYHLINEAAPAEPDLCAELECPDDCSGRHDTEHIDCGPDAIFEDLAEHRVEIERPEEPSSGMARVEAKSDPTNMTEGMVTALRYYGIDTEDAEVLVSAAAVGLVLDAWWDEPLEAIQASPQGPTDGEMFAQSVDLQRRARAALLRAREDGPDALLAFQAVASDIDLPWAGGSGFTLRASGIATEEFVENLDNRVWYTTEMMRERGWREGVLHRALSAASRGSDQFGMPGWPAAVDAAVERLAALDRSSAPEALVDLAKAKAILLTAPDQLGVAALDWLVSRVLGGHADSGEHSEVG